MVSAMMAAKSIQRLDGASLSGRILTLLLAGTCGGFLFTLIYLVEGATRPGYNTLSDAVSMLSLGPGGWMQQANFVLFGLLTLFCAAPGWRLALGSGPGSVAYPSLKALEGAGIVLVGFFSQDPVLGGYPVGAGASTPSLHGDLHNAFSGVIVSALALGSLALARRFAIEPKWGLPYAVLAVITAVLTILFISVFGAMGAHGGLAGLFERLAFGVNAILSVVVVGRLSVQYLTRRAALET